MSDSVIRYFEDMDIKIERSETSLSDRGYDNLVRVGVLDGDEVLEGVVKEYLTFEHGFLFVL